MRARQQRQRASRRPALRRHLRLVAVLATRRAQHHRLPALPRLRARLQSRMCAFSHSLLVTLTLRCGFDSHKGQKSVCEAWSFVLCLVRLVVLYVQALPSVSLSSVSDQMAVSE